MNDLESARFERVLKRARPNVSSVSDDAHLAQTYPFIPRAEREARESTVEFSILSRTDWTADCGDGSSSWETAGPVLASILR